MSKYPDDIVELLELLQKEDEAVYYFDHTIITTRSDVFEELIDIFKAGDVGITIARLKDEVYEKQTVCDKDSGQEE